jgi:inorganic triphosphatase YgiF
MGMRDRNNTSNFGRSPSGQGEIAARSRILPVHIERELKFRLTGRALPRLERLAPERRSVSSIYYDTPGQRLRRAGVALRLRRDGKRWLQTLKSESAQHAGLAARAEWETPVRRNALDLCAFPADEIKAATGLQLAALASELRPLFTTRFVRHSGAVDLPHGGRAELCVDRGAIVAGRRREPIAEAELELKSGSLRGLLRFAEKLGLPLAYESKAERGYRLARALPRAPRTWRTPALDPNASPGAAFALIFNATLAQAGANAQGVLDSADPEYLHQMRVGLRRLRSALRAFDPVTETPRPLKRRLRRVMKALGPARDWTVLVQRLAEVRANRRLIARARRRSNAENQAARAVAASKEFQSFVLRALRWIGSEPWRSSSDSLVRFGAASLERLRSKLERPADWKSAKHRHSLRIRVKRLRYACEFFAPCFPARAVERYLKRLRTLQELLGELNDIAVGRELLARLGERHPEVFDARERRLIGALSGSWTALEKQPRYWRSPP